MTISVVHDRIDKESTERRKELEKGPRKSEGYALSCLPSTLAWHQTGFLFCIIKICRPAALACSLDAARTSSTRPPSVPSAEQHAKDLDHLDAARIFLAKALNDADSSVTSKQADLTRLKEELREFGEIDPDPAAEYELDGTA